MRPNQPRDRKRHKLNTGAQEGTRTLGAQVSRKQEVTTKTHEGITRK